MQCSKSQANCWPVPSSLKPTGKLLYPRVSAQRETGSWHRENCWSGHAKWFLEPGACVKPPRKHLFLQLFQRRPVVKAVLEDGLRWGTFWEAPNPALAMQDETSLHLSSGQQSVPCGSARGCCRLQEEPRSAACHSQHSEMHNWSLTDTVPASWNARWKDCNAQAIQS